MPQDSRQEPLSGTHGHGPGAPVTPARPVGSDTALAQEKSGIGAKIRKISGGNPNSINNMDRGEIDGFLDNKQESGDMFIGNTAKYISYQPL
ncbi:unspecified product [Plasmodium ovale curtisi]|uniref:Unspecified product n=1 Tax=Plasmodium ovale curtisi TaxID=864141 RepID=A0A1A8XC54_PLAOA|nr:unspecified product [Plasmodium ovale curtisi]